MTIWFVHRAGGPGTPISWAGQYLQKGYAEEQLDDANSAELQGFLNPAPDLAAVFEQKKKEGFQLVSAGTPVISGVYSADATSSGQVWLIALGVAAGLGFPLGAPSFGYPDINGDLHQFDAKGFVDFAKSMRDYYYSLQIAYEAQANGQQAPWPNSTIKIP